MPFRARTRTFINAQLVCSVQDVAPASIDRKQLEVEVLSEKCRLKAVQKMLKQHKSEIAALPRAVPAKLSLLRPMQLTAETVGRISQQFRVVSDSVCRYTTTSQLRVPRRSVVVGIDINVASLDMTDGVHHVQSDMRPFYERAKSARRNERRFANFGKDFVRKQVAIIVDFCRQAGVAAVVLEDLAGLRESATKKKCAKGRQYRHMINAGLPYGQLRVQLEAKLREAGIRVVSIDPDYTSQTCAGCGHGHRRNRKTTEGFRCLKCGLQCNAQLNAALNIRHRGLIKLLATLGSRFGQAELHAFERCQYRRIAGIGL